ncbi:MAG: polysaccharide biosynthesis tyrosine autokinase [Armatimonadota bacterium]|nr:polysaccharide biosynthesis tyrosine autokinase [Armatimonadota bacterium]
MEFWRYYRVLRRRRWIILAAVVACLTVVVVTDRPRAADYQATATLTIAAPDERRLLFVFAGGGTLDRPDLQTALALELIRSRTVAERVVQRLNLDIHPAELQFRIRAEKDRASELVRVTVTGRTAAEAIVLANAVAEVAAAYHQEVNRREATLAREFVERQIGEVETALRRAEEALLTFRQRNPGLGQAGAQAGRLASLESSLQAVEVDLRQVEARLAAVRRRMAEQDPTRSQQEIVDNPVARQLRAELVQLEVALTSEMAVHTPEHPTVLQLQAKIDAVKRRLGQELARVVASELVQANPVYDLLAQSRIALETDRVALQAKREALQRALADTRRDLPDAYRRELEHSRLARAVEVLSTRYRDLQNRLGEVRIKEQEAQHRGTLTLVDRATTAQPAPFRGQRFRLTLAAVLGLLAGVGLSFFLEYLDNTVKTARDAEQLLAMPALATIPRHNPPFDEAYRLLRATLAARVNGRASRVLTVTSPRPGSGTSTVVANLARAFAQSGRRTVVVDADLHRPVQHIRFRVSYQRGLSEVLRGECALDDALVETGIPHLQLLPSGEPVPDPGALLGSRAMQHLLGELKPRADLVLIDTPSAGAFADVFSLVPLAPSVLLVLGAGVPPRGIEQDVKTRLERVGAEMVGVVLNRVRPEFVDAYFYHERVRNGGHRGRFRRSGIRSSLAVLVFAIGLVGGIYARSSGLPGLSVLARQAREWAAVLPTGLRSGSVR